MEKKRISDTTKQRDIKREPKLKKQKVAKQESLLGKKVFVVAHKEGVIGVFAEKADAERAKKKAADETPAKIYSKTIK